MKWAGLWTRNRRIFGRKWLQPRRGHDGALDFFESLEQEQIHRFEPTRILEEDNVVLVLLNLELAVKRTGIRMVEEDGVHIWHFNERGLIVRFRHRVDTLQHVRAAAGVYGLVS